VARQIIVSAVSVMMLGVVLHFSVAEVGSLRATCVLNKDGHPLLLGVGGFLELQEFHLSTDTLFFKETSQPQSYPALL